MPIDLDRLLTPLNLSNIQQTNNPLYQVISQLLKAVRALQDENDTSIGGNIIDITTLKNRTYWTELDETANLPASRQVLAGTNITLDYAVSGKVTVNASGGSPAEDGYWAPLTDGDLDETDLIFADGECVMVFIPT